LYDSSIANLNYEILLIIAYLEFVEDEKVKYTRLIMNKFGFVR